MNGKIIKSSLESCANDNCENCHYIEQCAFGDCACSLHADALHYIKCLEEIIHLIRKENDYES